MAAVEVGDLVDADLLDLMDNPPICRLIQQAAQSFTNNTNTALTFGAGSEDIDTDGFHDTVTNNARVTPTVAGYYECTGSFTLAAGRTDMIDQSCAIRKNGTIAQPYTRQGRTAISVINSVQSKAILSANGTTDYFELSGTQSNTGAAAVNTQVATFFSVFEVQFLRPL